MKRNYFAKHGIRFRVWSRKKYAAFCSLGCYVTIGCLRKGITETALRKQKKILLPSSSEVFRQEQNECMETKLKAFSEFLLLLSLFLQPQKVIGDICGKINYFFIKNGTQRM